MTSPLTATLARALYQDSTGPGFDQEPPRVREDWYRYAERVLGTEDGKLVRGVVAAAEAVGERFDSDEATPRSLGVAIEDMGMALDALREPSDDAGAAA
jgi:hypothetical protein